MKLASYKFKNKNSLKESLYFSGLLERKSRAVGN